MNTTNIAPTDKSNVPASQTRPEDGLPPVVKKTGEEEKEKIEQEVKQTFKDPDVPVEPVLGNDGVEVGGEG